MPDLQWIPQDILEDGNKEIVLFVASGSLKDNFMGLELDGSKKFTMMSINIHTMENNKIAQVYHIEE